MVCFLSTRINPPTSRRGARTASTSSSVVKRASEGSTAEADEADEHDAGVACSARAKTRARRASDARAPAPARDTTARTADVDIAAEPPTNHNARRGVPAKATRDEGTGGAGHQSR